LTKFTRLKRSVYDSVKTRITKIVPKQGYFLRSESFFNLATEIGKLDAEGGEGKRIIDGYGGKSLHEQSHGESFWALFMNCFSGNGLYILDEPEAALFRPGKWLCW